MSRPVLFSADTAATWLGLPGRYDDVAVTNVQTDSRAIAPGALFVALPGEVSDGERYVAQAFAGGAELAIVSESFIVDAAAIQAGATEQRLLRVPDRYHALHTLAAAYRAATLSQATRVGITGSNGKTTTKELLLAMLQTTGQAVFASAGNLNSETGVPLSIFQTPPDVAIAVYEMGMSNPGEMSALARIVDPDLALITNIGTAHIAQLGSRRAIALEKRDIAANFSGSQVLVVPERDDFVELLSSDVNGRVERYGTEVQNARVLHHGSEATVLVAGQRCRLTPGGNHRVQLFLAALALAERLGVQPGDAIAAAEAFRPPAGRGGVVEGIRSVIDDSYNASPESMIAAIAAAEAAAATERSLTLVLGDMLELGQYAAAAHQQVLERALASDAQHLILVGAAFARAAAAAEDSRITLCRDVAAAGDAIAGLPSGGVVLIKASLGIGLKPLVALATQGVAEANHA